MKIFSCKNYEQMSRATANIISAQVILKPDCVLGLATGSSPIGTYKQLVDWYKKGDLSFKSTITVNLDEYIGLNDSHDQSYRYFMDNNLFNHIDINKGNTHIPNGTAKDSETECNNYTKLIEDLGGVDLQLLGIGLNGHIGFNEPDDCFSLNTHIVNLTDSTIKANSRFFENDLSNVPTQAITMGLKSIMTAKKILIIANGIDKSEILYKTFKGPITPRVPASILQLHPDVTLIADEPALSKLANN